MGREHFVGHRAYHEDSGHEGVILDVHLHVKKQTALFQHDGTGLAAANWVNLEKLKVLGPDLLFGGASVGLVIFMIAAAVLLSYPRMVMKFDNLKPRSPVDTMSDQEHHLDTNKLLGETPFEPASVTEHSTELLKERR